MVLKAEGITKVYKRRGKPEVVANKELSLSIKEGEIVGLLGHNGAGKTTFVNQIVGIMAPTSGEIELLGESVLKDPMRARSICSVQPQSQIALGNLTPARAISLMGNMRLGDKAEVQRRMDRLFEELDMGQWVNTEGMNLSGGVQRLTAFCMAVICPGKLVILDEPTNNIDPVRRRLLWNVIRRLTEDGTSVILVTHNVLEAEKAVDRVAILHKGEFIAQGTPSNIKQSIDNQMRMEISLVDDSTKLIIPEWANLIYQNGVRMIVTIKQSSVLLSVKWIQNEIENNKVIDYSLSPITLEDHYVSLTSGKDDVVENEFNSREGVSL